MPAIKSLFLPNKLFLFFKGCKNILATFLKKIKMYKIIFFKGIIYLKKKHKNAIRTKNRKKSLV